MFPIEIRDHSPMDDYKKIQSQIKYTVQYAPFFDSEKPDYKKNLINNKSYKIAYKVMIKLLILTGIGTVVSIIAGFVFSHDSFSNIERKILMIMVLATCAFFIISLLIGLVGAPIEIRAEKKDREISISLDQKTWILNNGQVVVSDEQKFRGKQMYNSHNCSTIEDIPFMRMIIIYKVYSVTRVDRKIIVDGDIREFYRKHPCEEMSLYCYYQNDKMDKIIWYENMYGRERLLEALSRMKV